jgi:hypothetical protein
LLKTIPNIGGLGFHENPLKDYVCSTQVLRGIGKEIDKKAEATVRQWHFDPARKKNGRTVPVIKTVEVNYWATSTGEISSDPPHAPSPVQPGEARKKIG